MLSIEKEDFDFELDKATWLPAIRYRNPAKKTHTQIVHFDLINSGNNQKI